MTDYSTLSVATLTEMFNDITGKTIKVGSYPKSKLIPMIEAELDAQATEDPAADPMRPEEDWPTQEVTSEPVDPLTFEEAPGGVGYPAPAPTTEDEASTVEARLARGECPLCGAEHSAQTAAGEEGTFLGDSCNLCHHCGKTYNHITGVEVPTRDTKKRRILNPQAKIDAKEAALAEANFKLDYDRPARMWYVTSTIEGEAGVWNLTSKQFAEFNQAEIVASAEARLRPQA